MTILNAHTQELWANTSINPFYIDFTFSETSRFNIYFYFRLALKDFLSFVTYNLTSLLYLVIVTFLFTAKLNFKTMEFEDISPY